MEDAVAERFTHVVTRSLISEGFFGDDLVQRLFSTCFYKLFPLRVDLAVDGRRIHERLNPVALISQAEGCVQCMRDLCTDLFVFVVAALFSVVLDQHQDVVDVDLNLLDEFQLKDQVVLNGFLVRFDP